MAQGTGWALQPATPLPHSAIVSAGCGGCEWRVWPHSGVTEVRGVFGGWRGEVHEGNLLTVAVHVLGRCRAAHGRRGGGGGGEQQGGGRSDRCHPAALRCEGNGRNAPDG